VPKKAVLLLAAVLGVLGACSRESSDQKGGPGEKAGRNMQGASKGEK